MSIFPNSILNFFTGRLPLARRLGQGGLLLACACGWPACTRQALLDLDAQTVTVPAGRFIMGSREAGSPVPPRAVTLAAFRLGRHEVTVAEYTGYRNALKDDGAAHPQLTGRPGSWRPKSGLARHPVAYLTRDEAAAYCRWLSRATGRGVRLPSAAEWEYAARGGLARARYPWGWGGPRGRACFAAAASAPVGSFAPNPWGLFDMAGNVFEWCQSGDAAEAGGRAVACGGAWSEQNEAMLRVDRRAWFAADYRNADVGFRIAVDITPTASAGSASAACSQPASAPARSGPG